MAMVVFWPIESLRDALVETFHARSKALGGHSRLSVAWNAWVAAMRWNLPPVDFLAYRLFERGQPGPAHWLHSADAHIHFSAIAAAEVRTLAQDKLAFARFCEARGVPVVPMLAAVGPGGMAQEFTDGRLPEVSLIVKPRRGHGGRSHRVWRWNGARHVADGMAADISISEWLARQANEGDLVVQEFVQPPDRFGPVVPAAAPAVSIITAEDPDRQRLPVAAFVVFDTGSDDGARRCVRMIDLDAGTVLPTTPAQREPVWAEAESVNSPGAFELPRWQQMLAIIDNVHAALPGPSPVLKWDLLVTCDGPRLLEANTGTGIFGLQSITLRPLTETPLGDALEAWAE